MRYFLGFLVAIGLIILVIYLLFSGGGKPKVPATNKTLDSYSSTDAEVSMTVDGPVNAAQLHQGLRITADRDNVTFEQLQGYDGTVVSMQRFPNTENAYSAFLLSLAHAGFTQGDTNTKLRDERGYCPIGDRYIFEIKQDNKQLERYWATSCGKPKTYLGSFGLTIQLFQNQVPNYNDLTQNIKL